MHSVPLHIYAICQHPPAAFSEWRKVQLFWTAQSHALIKKLMHDCIMKRDVVYQKQNHKTNKRLSFPSGGAEEDWSVDVSLLWRFLCFSHVEVGYF